MAEVNEDRAAAADKAGEDVVVGSRDEGVAVAAAARDAEDVRAGGRDEDRERVAVASGAGADREVGVVAEVRATVGAVADQGPRHLPTAATNAAGEAANETVEEAASSAPRFAPSRTRGSQLREAAASVGGVS